MIGTYKNLDPCGGLVGTGTGEGEAILVGAPSPPPPHPRGGTVDLTFQFDNPLTGQARGQTSLVGSRYPQKFPLLVHCPTPLQHQLLVSPTAADAVHTEQMGVGSGNDRRCFMLKMLRWRECGEDHKAESTMALLVHNALPSYMQGIMLLPRMINTLH